MPGAEAVDCGTKGSDIPEGGAADVVFAVVTAVGTGEEGEQNEDGEGC